MADTQLQSAQLAVQEVPGKKRFLGLGGLIERYRDGRECSRTVSLLDSSLRAGSLGGPHFEAALESFKGLSPLNKDKVLAEAAGMFGRYAPFTFDSQEKVASMTTLSVFVAEAAATMPKGADGTTGCACIGALVRELKSLSKDDTLYQRDAEGHAAAKLAAAVALWELGYMDYAFWEDRLSEGATRDFTITKLLEMPQTAEWPEHGWHLLRKNLTADLGRSIALSGSPRKTDFLTSMMVDTDERVVVSALEGAIYLNPLPPEFIDMAAEASRRSRELDVKAGFFISAARVRPLLEAADDAQYYAASHLTMLYSQGMRHLGPLLQGVVFPEMRDVFNEPAGATEAEQGAERAKAAGVILQLHMAGIRTEGFTFNMEEG